MYSIVRAHNSDIILVFILMFLCHVMDFLVVVKVVKCDLLANICLYVVFPVLITTSCRFNCVFLKWLIPLDVVA